MSFRTRIIKKIAFVLNQIFLNNKYQSTFKFIIQDRTLLYTVQFLSAS